MAEPATFDGIVRADGRVATRNYIGVLTSVNCSATAARAIADHFRRDIRPEALADFPNVDGVVALTHGMGCATDSEGEELQVLRRTLGGYARHPNFAAVLVVGLGCETNQIQGLVAQEGLQEGARLVTFNIQDTGGTAKTVARGVEEIKRLLPEANRVQRQPVPARHLTVGLQCGGSDGYSGISANPALGAAVDRLVRHGGTAILSETPEIYGGEHLLTRRAVSRAVADKLLARIAWWEAVHRAQRHADGQQPLGRQQGRRPDDDPGKEPGRHRQERHHQPGRRAASSPRASRARGFVYMDTPGYDPVSATGPGGGRRQPHLLHHRPRLGLRLRAVALAQVQHQHRAVAQAAGRHRHRLRRHRRRPGHRGRGRRAHLPPHAGDRLGPRHEERTARLRAERVRALAAGRGDVGAQGPALDPGSSTLIDDRRGPRPAAWRFFTDGVMGGVSSGGMSAETAAGRAALCLRGEVRLDNGGGFIQMALELPAPPAATWRGIELDVLGNGRRYGLHLRTSDMTLPWQAWRATFSAAPVWQTVQLPFAEFAPHRTPGRLDPATIRRIGIVALGEAMTAEICVGRLAWLR